VPAAAHVRLRHADVQGGQHFLESDGLVRRSGCGGAPRFDFRPQSFDLVIPVLLADQIAPSTLTLLLQLRSQPFDFVGCGAFTAQ
jgi:hypothetical protein